MLYGFVTTGIRENSKVIESAHSHYLQTVIWATVKASFRASFRLESGSFAG